MKRPSTCRSYAARTASRGPSVLVVTRPTVETAAARPGPFRPVVLLSGNNIAHSWTGSRPRPRASPARPPPALSYPGATVTAWLPVPRPPPSRARPTAAPSAATNCPSGSAAARSATPGARSRSTARCRSGRRPPGRSARPPARSARWTARWRRPAPPACPSWTGCSAAAWSRVPWCCWPASRASASPPCCWTSRPRPPVRSTARSTSPARSRPARCGCAPTGSTRSPSTSTSPPSPTSAPSSATSRRSIPVC